MTARKMIQPNTWSFRSGQGNPGARIFASRVTAGHPGNYVENYRIRRHRAAKPQAERTQQRHQGLTCVPRRLALRALLPAPRQLVNRHVPCGTR
ncbi:hypothetical protein GCM10010321_01540 [Streptomyces chartreusis]|nr:hypothetical protein GCM10010321_01540 [Streptomyces chartreusis]